MRIFFISLAISRPLTGCEDPTILYDLISSSTLKDAFQDGKQYIQYLNSSFNECSFTPVYLCVLGSNEGQTESIFS